MRSEQTKEWAPDPVEHVLSGHSDWVRDVAWAPSVGVGKAYLASAGQDKTVLIWTQSDPRSAWNRTALEPTASQAAAGGAGAQQQQQQQQQAPPEEGKFADAVWRVSWSVAGNVLAVSSGAYFRSTSFFRSCKPADMFLPVGDGKVSLWKENLKGKFEEVSQMAS